MYLLMLIPLIAACGQDFSHCSQPTPPTTPLQGSAGNVTQLRALQRLALRNESAGNLEAARKAYQQELTVLAKMGNAGAIGSGEVYTSLAGLCQIEGRLQESEAIYKKGIIAAMSQFGLVDDLRMARAWEGLYWLYTDESAERILFLDSEGVLFSQSGRYGSLPNCASEIPRLVSPHP